MSLSVFDRGGWRPRLLLGATLLAATATPLTAQDAVEGATSTIQSSEITLSRGQANLHLELSSGRILDMAIREGRVILDGAPIGNAARGGNLDRAWRELLNQAIDTPADALGDLLIGWNAPSGGTARRLDAALEAALGGQVTSEATEAAQAAVGAQTADSIERLNEEIERLKSEIDRRVVVREVPRQRARPSPFRHISRGIGNLVAILVTYAVIFGIGLAVIFFGGRKYIEAVADTARHQTLRSLFVGVAGACLLLPAFVLGAIALVISIVGIPALLAWVPLFPVAAALAVLLGYISVAHAAGESLAERRFYATDWFQRGNSYYFLITGLGVLVALFMAAQIVSMAGPVLGFFSGLLMVLGVVVTFIALAVGFGAVLISRAGTRPVRPVEPDLFGENAGA